MQMAVLVALLMLFYDSSYAKESKTYVLKDPGGLVEVNRATKNKPADKEAVMMRDPNLGGSAKAVVALKVAPFPPKHVANKSAHKVVPTRKYKPVKVAAAVRMPRVEFNLPKLPVGMREESVETDFTERSLSEFPRE